MIWHKSKLNDAGCVGAPDLIVEVLSPDSNKKDLQIKYEVYVENSVPEYWIIHPIEQTLSIYSLKNYSDVPSRVYTSGDVVMSTVMAGFVIDLEAFFKEMD